MGFNYARAKRTVDRQIARFGGGKNNAVLRRAGVDRYCTAAFLEFDPRDRALLLDGVRRVLVSAEGLDVPPSHELDLLVFAGEVLRIVEPPRGPRPSGAALFYDMKVVYQAQA